MPAKSNLEISDYQKACNEMEQLYTQLQKYSGLPDAEYWCMMAVHKGECQYQHEISNQYFMSKQTINSALRQLEKRGYINIVTPDNNRRIRQIVFTKAGDALAEKYLDVVQEVEKRVWSGLSFVQQNALVETLNDMNQLLRKEVEQLQTTE